MMLSLKMEKIADNVADIADAVTAVVVAVEVTVVTADSMTDIPVMDAGKLTLLSRVCLE